MNIPAATDIALALAIFRSKPVDVTTRDYIQSLRASRKTGCRPSEDRSDSHLDAIAFWQSECQRLNNEKNRLESMIVNLRHENDALKTSSDAPSSSQLPSRNSKKGKASGEAPLRRAQGSVLTTITNTEQINNNVDSIEYLERLEHGGTLAKGVYRLHKIIAENSPDTHELSSVLSETSAALTAVLESASKALTDGEAQEGPSDILQRLSLNYVSNIRAAGRVYASIVRGFDVLDIFGDGSRLRGPVVYHITQCFRVVTTALDITATKSILTEAPRPVSRTSRTTGQSTTRELASETLSILEALKQLAISMLNCLDPIKSAHDELFEGFVFILLQQIGQKLYLLTFQQVATGDVARDIIATPADDKELQAATVAAPHLVDILKTALTRAPKHLRPRSAGADRLTDTARIKLQRTLVHCTFGKEGMTKEALTDCLQPPAFAEMEPRSRPVKKGKNNKQQPDADWFAYEVWGLLGWDILGQEGELASATMEE
ncbi:hypothetical protein MBLNU457_1857t1 [Dothideomycetes sp. NU457]